MHHVMHYIACFLIFDLFTSISAKNNETKIIDKLNINDIVNALVLTIDTKIDTRINELKEKLSKINSYVVDKEKYAQLLTNITTETDLNETSFFNALNEDEQFKFLAEPESKNLYLKMKEKMNRDDIMKILSERGDNKKIVNLARKSMGVDYFNAKDDNDEILDTVVDKMLGETPSDDHKFDAKENLSMYWDPQTELEDLKEHHNHNGRRIFRGERCSVKYYPFMVSVHVMGRFWCGGAIYWHDLVLTSAACLQLMHNNRFFRENPRVLQVRIGSNHSRLGGELIDALEVYFHPSYNPRTLRHNIAVIRLRRHLSFSYHRIPKIISISHSSYPLPATAEVMLLGWGVTKMSKKMSYEPVYLQRKVLPVYPNKFCKEVYGDKFLTDTMFCAGTFTTGEGACDHDAGGPAILAGRLVGIISFGPAICGYPNAPTVFTLVGAFSDWIETVNETMPTYSRGRGRTTTTTRMPLFDYLATIYPPAKVFQTGVDIQPMKLVTEVTTTTERTTTTEWTTTTEATEATPEANDIPGDIPGNIPGDIPGDIPAALRLSRHPSRSSDNSWGD